MIIDNNWVRASVIAAFTSEGKIRPIYLRIPEVSQDAVKIKILQKHSHGNYAESFDCAYEIEGYERVAKLMYWFNEHTWTLRKAE